MQPPSVSGQAVRVEYAPSVLEQIRAAAVEGLCKVPRGGIETGGVLFGRAVNGLVHVAAQRPIPCSYAHGPSFDPAGADAGGFAATLASARFDPELAGLEPIGWYHAYTRSGPEPGESDRRAHERFFPRGPAIVLLLRPDSFGSARLRTYVGRGLLETEAEETLLKPVRRMPPVADLSPAMVVAPAFMPRRIAAAPRTARPPARRWLAVPAVLAATIAMAAAWWWWRRPPAPAPEGAGLQLRVADLGGQLHIVWDRRAAAVVHAAAGTLEIADGGERTRVPFSPEHLRSGNVTYMPRSANVEVRLSVVAADGRRSEELVRFVGRQVAPPPEPPPQIAVAPPRVENRPAAEDRIRTDTPPPALRAFRMAEPRRSSRAPTLAAPPPEEFATRSVPGQAAGLVPLIASAEPPSPQLSLRTRATVAEPSRPQPPAAPVYSGPRSGRLIWTGELSAGAPLNIQGGRSSSGYLNGELPGIPVRIAAHAAELTSGGMRVWASNLAAVRDVAEPAGPENGWNRTSYAWDARRAQDVLVIDPPSEKNAWKGLALRGTRDRLSVIVIDWRVAQ